MKTGTFYQLKAGLLSLSVLGLASCERLKTAAAKISKPETKEAEGAAAKPSYSQSQISDITPSSYASFIAKENALMVVDFHAAWCGPCKILAPVLARAAEQHPGVVFIGKMDVDQAGDFPGKQGVQGIPDVRIFKNGKEVDRFVGFPGENAVLELISKHAKGIQAPPAAPASSEPAIKPFSKDWLPPGMSRKGEELPAQAPAK
jgi:thioredoxin 1